MSGYCFFAKGYYTFMPSHQACQKEGNSSILYEKVYLCVNCIANVHNVWEDWQPFEVHEFAMEEHLSYGKRCSQCTDYISEIRPSELCCGTEEKIEPLNLSVENQIIDLTKDEEVADVDGPSNWCVYDTITVEDTDDEDDDIDIIEKFYDVYSEPIIDEYDDEDDYLAAREAWIHGPVKTKFTM